MRALLSLALACCGFAAAYRVCDVVDYGAVGDGATQNIVAIRAALADCSDATEESAALSGGGLFVGAPFNLSSHMVLEVLGTLRGTTNVSLVPLMAPFPSMGGDITRDGHACRFAPLVGAFQARNITITGGGVIDGAGA